MTQEVRAVEEEIGKLTERLAILRRDANDTADVPDYPFDTLTGKVSLRDLFLGKQTLFAIHNMGQGCRYCTLWADGLNGFLPHLEDQYSVVLLSKDSPDVQQRFAHSRGWRFRMASHGGGAYISEQSVVPGETNMPGIVCYQQDGPKIIRKNSSVFGPGDSFCGIWHVLSLAGVGAEEWTPQYNYWKRPDPDSMDDGGRNLR